MKIRLLLRIILKVCFIRYMFGVNVDKTDIKLSSEVGEIYEVISRIISAI